MPLPAQTLVIEGTGNGHGVGMSQDGARATRGTASPTQQILAHYYSGTTLGHAPAKAVVKVLVGSKVKKIPLERYVRGVIAAEMSSSWPAAALEAQAVASRTYALTDHAGGSRFDVYSDTRSQVYRGAAAETAATNAAVAATAGRSSPTAASPAITYFFASSGGMTESVQDGFPGAEAEPWLIGVADSYEGSAARWKVEVPFATAARRLRGLYRGQFHGVEVVKRGVSPRVLIARVLGTRSRVAGQRPDTRGAARPGQHLGVLLRAHRQRRLRPEPDHSGRARLFGPLTGSSPNQPPPPATPAAWRRPAAARRRPPAQAAVPRPGAEKTGAATPAPARVPPHRHRAAYPNICPAGGRRLKVPSRAHEWRRMRTRVPCALLIGVLAALALGPAAGAHSTGTPAQIAWVRRAAGNFVTAELQGTERLHAASSLPGCAGATARAAGTRV